MNMATHSSTGSKSSGLKSKTNIKPSWDNRKSDRLGNPKRGGHMPSSTATASAAPKASEKKTEKKTTVTKDGAKEAARGTLKALGEKVIKIMVQENPKREGTRAYKRFATYKDGMTVKEYVEKGGAMSAIRYDVAHNYIALV